MNLARITKHVQETYGDEYDGWRSVSETPLAEIPVEKAKEALALFASLLLPAIGAARRAQERLTRDLAAMQVIEALRIVEVVPELAVPWTKPAD